MLSTDHVSASDLVVTAVSRTLNCWRRNYRTILEWNCEPQIAVVYGLLVRQLRNSHSSFSGRCRAPFTSWCSVLSKSRSQWFSHFPLVFKSRSRLRPSYSQSLWWLKRVRTGQGAGFLIAHRVSSTRTKWQKDKEIRGIDPTLNDSELMKLQIKSCRDNVCGPSHLRRIHISWPTQCCYNAINQGCFLLLEAPSNRFSIRTTGVINTC